jgi:hypothetical protein
MFMASIEMQILCGITGVSLQITQSIKSQKFIELVPYTASARGELVSQCHNITSVASSTPHNVNRAPARGGLLHLSRYSLE